MTATPRELAHASELRSTLVELNNAAIDARHHVERGAAASLLAGDGERATQGALALERLDAAIADAGNLLAEVLP